MPDRYRRLGCLRRAARVLGGASVERDRRLSRGARAPALGRCDDPDPRGARGGHYALIHAVADPPEEVALAVREEMRLGQIRRPFW